MLDKVRKKILEGRTALLKARKNMAFITSYENAILQEYNDNRVECMMLFFAEVLHDEMGFGQKRIARVLDGIDRSMTEFFNQEFDLDQLKVRVYKKCNFLWVANEEEQRYMVALLEANGIKVDLEGNTEEQ